MHRLEVETLAEVIRDRRKAHIGIGTISDANRIALQAVEATARDMCAKLKSQSPKFNDALFMRACGMSTHKPD